MIIKVDLTKQELRSLNDFLDSRLNGYSFYYWNPMDMDWQNYAEFRTAPITHITRIRKSKKMPKISCVTLEVLDHYNACSDPMLIVSGEGWNQKTRIEYLVNLFDSMGNKFPKKIMKV